MKRIVAFWGVLVVEGSGDGGDEYDGTTTGGWFQVLNDYIFPSSFGGDQGDNNKPVGAILSFVFLNAPKGVFSNIVQFAFR